MVCAQLPSADEVRYTHILPQRQQYCLLVIWSFAANETQFSEMMTVCLLESASCVLFRAAVPPHFSFCFISYWFRGFPLFIALEKKLKHDAGGLLSTF